ncbi:MAG: bacillithiol biosynthesis cysteine-adding enzyme BshC [Acidobacteriota bacterium]
MQSDSTVTQTSAGLGVEIRRFPWIRRFATDYAGAFDRVAPYFSGNPARPDAWRTAISQRHAALASPAALAALIDAQQERRGAPHESRATARQLADPRAVVVITGQQAGLFGGPLFTLLKALTTLKLARRVAAEHGVPVVPVFWIDAEDHDWAEVNQCTVLDSDATPRTLRLPDPAGAGDQPIARLRLDHDVFPVLDQMARALPDSEFRGKLLEQLTEAYQPGRSMADAFGCLIEAWLGRYGLVVYDSSDAAAKPLAAPIFSQELSDPGATARLASAAGQSLVAAGYHAQATPPDGAVSLFYLNNGRESVQVVGTRATIGERETSLAALLDEVKDFPEHFSPNVLLRPIVQDRLFPTICYVAGPNELAYLGQLREIYTHFGVPMPLMYQRATATIVDSATRRFLAKYQLPLEGLQAQDEAALNQLLQEQLPPTVEGALSRASELVREQMALVAEAVKQIDPTLGGAVKSTLGRMEHDLRSLHNKVIQAAKRRDDTLRRQFQRAQGLTFPNGHPQEREVGVVWFFNRYGPALVDRLLEELSLEMGIHWVMTI